MSMQYPVLGNRPINQWKVAELKEELKRRNLTVKGLKDDLIKRLHESIRNERGAFEEESSIGAGHDPVPLVNSEDARSLPNNEDISKPAKIGDAVDWVDIDDGLGKTDRGKVQEEEAIGGTGSVGLTLGQPVLEGSVETSVKGNEIVVTQIASGDEDREKTEINYGNQDSNTSIVDGVVVGDVVAGVEVDDGPAKTDRGKVQEEEARSGTGSIGLTLGEPVLAASVETGIKVDEIVVNEIASGDEAPNHNEFSLENEDSKPSPVDAVMVGEQAVLEASVESNNIMNDIVVTQVAASDKPLGNYEIKMENDHSQPIEIDAELTSLDPDDQVSEARPNLEIQAKSELILTNIASLCEINELKDNLNADNVHLELDVTKLEIVPPSRVSLDEGNSHPMDVEKPHQKQDFDEQSDDTKSTHVDFSNKTDIGDVGSSMISKLDHNMIDDIKHDYVEVGGNIELIDLPVAKEKSPDDIVGLDLSPDKLGTSAQRTSRDEERKLQGVDLSEISGVADEGPLEKINLDPSPADDFMEDDALETKDIGSNYDSVEIANIESNKVPGGHVSGKGDAIGSDFSSVNKMEFPSERKNTVDAPEKRKSQDEASVENKEPPKRQRRWNSDGVKISGTESSSQSLSAVSVLKPHITRSDSTLGGDAPQKGNVPPSPKSPTNSLRIDNFLRPFTLKAVQELLAKTGKVCSFWMDQIKTHCYVTYSSVEEAIETRNAVYNLQWPTNGGRLLVAEFVDPQEVKLLVEPTSESSATAAAAPVTTTPTVSSARPPIQSPSPRQHGLKQQRLLPQAQAPPVQQPPPASDPARTRERLSLPPPPPPPAAEKIELPIVTLDDLFRKTRATPRIYYLPLTAEQVEVKLARQRENKQ